MKPIVGVLCALLILSACGRDRPVATAESAVTGVRSMLKKAFTPDEAPESGGLCGDPFLTGEVVGAVPGRISGCGIENAIRLRAVGNVGLTQPALMDCNTANALKIWLETGVRPAVGERGGGVKSLRVAAHYACRTRNHQPGGKISEHGKGKAIDISAINLVDGSQITLLEGWRDPKDGPVLKAMHRAACGPFGTVLGPESDRFHQDHFHFDTAQHRGGSYCR